MSGCLIYVGVFLVAVCCQTLSPSVTLADENQSHDETPVANKTASAEADYRDAVSPILEQYCFGCHGDGAAEGDFSFDEFLSVEAMTTDTKAWWSVLKNVRSDVMPPDGEDQPSQSEKRALFQWINKHVFSLVRGEADPGPGTLRRLNRVEYRNTIRDLMGVDFDTSVEFPPDDSGDGFDNNADALSISPLLAEKYIEAARKIVDLAVPKTTRVIPVQTINSNEFRTDIDPKTKRLSFKEASSTTATFDIARDEEYRIVIPIEISGSFNYSSARARIKVLLNGKVLHDGEYGWKSDFEKELTFERRLSKGKHSLQFTMTPVKTKAGTAKDDDEDGTFVKLEIPTARVEGPQNLAYWNMPDGYDRFFHLDRPPASAAERQQYAVDVLRRFCMRAFRRPVGESYLNRLLSVAGFSASPKAAASSMPSDSFTFEQRFGRAITAVLASPNFLFRIDRPQPDSKEKFPEVDEFSLASRLSYFLWSSMPDDELFRLAERGELRENLIEQVQRMLSDERSERFIENFTGQWLQTRDVESVSIDSLAAQGLRREYERLVDYLESTDSERRPPPDDASEEHHAAFKRYREIRERRDRLDGNVRSDMADETERLFSYVLREDRSLVELIQSDYAFLNERLAKHYGVSGVEGGEIRKVRLPAGSPLGGVLTQGTFLLVTSNPTRTSPVKRGLFILDNILGTPAPPAPPMVPELEESAEESELEQPTVRQLLEIHRSEALCRSCHARFDPLGLAFENFTAIGTWRDAENGQPIQPAGRLISGESFENVTELKRVLAGPRRMDFYRCLAERVLSYAIGRSLDFGDELALDRITDDLIDQDGRAQALMTGVVNSVAFQRMRQPDPDLRQQ